MDKSTHLSTGSSIFSMLLVFVSSACCIGPLAVVLSLVGLSGSTVLAMENIFGPYRVIILSLTVVFLATGFYLAYRPQKDDCEDDKICAKPNSRLIQRILLWLATVLMGVLLYFTYVHPNLDLWFEIY